MPADNNDNIRLDILNTDDGMLRISFPNANLVEGKNGPSPGFEIPPHMAIMIASTMIHAAMSIMGEENDPENGVVIKGYDDEQEDNEEEDDDDYKGRPN